ncbi:MAG: helix-turn-helix domain-containing protein [Streptosporangiaceae bacterium]
MDVRHGELLNVRETARRLGVHENTVRNWALDGLLPTARIPGSRFHRFDADDVERLRQQRGRAVASIQAERRTIGPELADGTLLSQWADTRDAQSMFPELIRRLLASTPGITNLSVRSAEGVSAPGWDGQADSVGTVYLPHGHLCFEFSADRHSKAKASADYEKRRDDPRRVVPAESTFVFVTPRRWAGGTAWARDRRAEGVFADVRVLDADDLEGWLQATPAIHYWISERLGRRPGDAETLEWWWTRFSNRTDPALPATLFLAGRERECESLEEFFGGRPSLITIHADWRDDAIAFVSAAITALTRETGKSVQPAFLVSSADVWNRTVAQHGRMTLLPLFDHPDFPAAEKQGHYVILLAGRDHAVRGTSIGLPRVGRESARQALAAAGIEFARAHDLAGLARRSMPSLVRTLARDPRIARPPWSQSSATKSLAPLVLAGAWTVSDGDTEVIAEMAGRPWPTVERTLLHWAETDDPPFVRSGRQWHLACAEEAFMLLYGKLTHEDRERWRRIASKVLLEPDPQLDLPPNDRVMAGVRGITRKYSQALRRGVAEGLALLGSMDHEQLSDDVSCAQHARDIVGGVLERAATDRSGRLWQSIADVLPLLAEASPQDFLDAVHKDLDRGEPLLAAMFQDSDRSSGLYGSSPHTGLLWALETLCWSSEHVVDASRGLARLEAIDPGGRLSNRPIESLQTVLAGWIRHTAASLELKIRAVDQICRQLPEVGWRLVSALWPSTHATLSPPARPRFRDWQPESQQVPISEWISYIGQIVGLVLDLAGDDPGRWADLSERLWPLPPAEQDRVLGALEAAADPHSLRADERLLLWERLHREASQHERFAAADWALASDPLSRLRAIADRLEPATGAQKYGYLFDWRPNLLGIDPLDHDTYEVRLLELRTQAVKDVIEIGSIDGLRRLAQRSPVPQHLGWVAGGVVPEELTPELLAWLDSEDSKLRDAASSWARRKLAGPGVEWLRHALGRPELTRHERRVALALSAPARQDVWDFIAEIEPTVSDAYWNQMDDWRVLAEDTERAARELVAHGRPWTAVTLLATHISAKTQRPASVTRALVEDALHAGAASNPSGGQLAMLGYEIGLLLDFLEAEGADQRSLAGFEFVFFQLIEPHRRPEALFAALGSEPSFFVDLVSRVYRAKDEPQRRLNQHDAALARHAWWVLAHWRRPPGLRPDGTIDGEHLERWVRGARLALADVGRADIGDEQIGQTLASSPPGADGIWPAEPVRAIIEDIGSPGIEAGIHVGVFNDRGVTGRGLYDGGQQERDLASRYRRWAGATSGRWPRTSRILRRLSETYEQEARREDAEARLSADT